MLNEMKSNAGLETEMRGRIFSMYESVLSSAHTYLKNMDENGLGNLYQLILAEVEIALLKKLLEYTNGNETRTAKILGISRGTFRTKCKEHGIDRLDFKWLKYRPVEKNKFISDKNFR